MTKRIWSEYREKRKEFEQTKNASFCVPKTKPELNQMKKKKTSTFRFLVFFSFSYYYDNYFGLRCEKRIIYDHPLLQHANSK